MNIEFYFTSPKNNGILGIYLGLLSVSSLIFVLGMYFSLTRQDTTLIHAPNNDSLTLQWWGLLIITIIDINICITLQKTQFGMICQY